MCTSSSSSRYSHSNPTLPRASIGSSNALFGLLSLSCNLR
jgi:hypothetical protein